MAWKINKRTGTHSEPTCVGWPFFKTIFLYKPRVFHSVSSRGFSSAEMREEADDALATLPPRPGRPAKMPPTSVRMTGSRKRRRPNAPLALFVRPGAPNVRSVLEIERSEEYPKACFWPCHGVAECAAMPKTDAPPLAESKNAALEPASGRQIVLLPVALDGTLFLSHTQNTNSVRQRPFLCSCERQILKPSSIQHFHGAGADFAGQVFS